MENISLLNKKINTLHSEHLHEDVIPIRAALIDSSIPLDPQTKDTISAIKKKGDFVNYYEDNAEILKKANIQGSIEKKGERGYVVSEINSRDKYSEAYRFCMGIVIVGKKKNSTENISFISHQDPPQLSFPSLGFGQALSGQIKNILEQCEPGTIDAVIIGGAVKKGKTQSEEQYKDSIKFFNNLVSPILGFEPVVLTGANYEKGTMEIYFKNDKRQLYLLRKAQENNSHVQSY